MYKFVVNGGRPLRGRVRISGAKNSVSAILPACVLVSGVCRIDNLPRIADTTLWLDVLSSMGARVRRLSNQSVEIDTTSLYTLAPSEEIMRKMRSSYYLVGALLGRYGSASVAMPGGCDFGTRPIDRHIKAFETLGAAVEIKNGIIHAKAPADGLTAGHIYFDETSVGATINAMLASATIAGGLTTIENAAKEPHVVDVANFLNSCGADIRGAGTDSIKVRGVVALRGSDYTIIPDQIEAGTYMACAVATGGDVIIDNIIPKHMECITAKFEEMGVRIEEGDEFIRVISDGPLHRTNVRTLPYPGFPTDLQPQIAAVLSLCDGTSLISEGVTENRFRYVDELRRMGGKIIVEGRTAVVEPVPYFTGASVCACDLRAGAALVVASLAARGVTEIDGVQYIERGYEDIVDKLTNLGASIQKVKIPDAVVSLKRG